MGKKQKLTIKDIAAIPVEDIPIINDPNNTDPKRPITIDDIKPGLVGANINYSDVGPQGAGTQYSPLEEHDIGLVQGVDQNRNRAINQSTLEQGAKTVGNLAPNVALGILENVGYLAELPGALAGNDTDYSNALTEWAKEQRSPFGDIYRENPNKLIDLGDPAFWFETGGGLVESIGEFLVTGYGVGSVLGKGSSALAQALKAGAAGTKALSGAAQLATAGTLSYVEGAMSGAQVYQDTYNQFLPEIGDELAKSKAAEAAAYTVKLNTAINTLLNVTSVAGAFKSTKSLYNAEKQGINKLAGESADAYVSRLAKISEEGLPSSLRTNGLVRLGLESSQEAVEEVVNVFAEQEGRIKGGLEEGEGNAVDRFIDAALSEEGMFSAALGAIGGVAQTGGMNRIRMHKTPKLDAAGNPIIVDGNVQYESVNASTLEQREKNEKYQNFVLSIANDFENLKDTQQDLRNATKEGNTDKMSELQDKLFSIAAYNQVSNGNANNLITTFEDIQKLSPEEAVEQGLADDLTDTSYKEKAARRVVQLRDLQKKYTDTMAKYDHGEAGDAGLGNYIFNLQTGMSSAKSTIGDLNAKRAEIEKDNSFRYSNSVEAQSKHESAKKALADKQKELNRIDVLSKSRKGKKKLYNKYNVRSVEDAKVFVESEIETLNDNLIAAKIAEDNAFESYKTLPQNTEKSESDVKKSFKKEMNKHASYVDTLTDIDKSITELNTYIDSTEEQYGKVTSKEGQKKFIQDINTYREEEIKESEERVAEQKAKVNTEQDKAKKMDLSPEKVLESFDARYKNPDLFDKEAATINANVRDLDIDPGLKEAVENATQSQEKFRGFMRGLYNPAPGSEGQIPGLDQIRETVTQYYDTVDGVNETFKEFGGDVDNQDILSDDTILTEDDQDLAEHEFNNPKNLSTPMVEFEFETTEGGRTITKLDKEGNPVPANNIAGINWNHVNNKDTLKPGTTIHYEVDMDTVFSKDDKYHNNLKPGRSFSDKAQVLMVDKSRGQDNIVSALPAYKKGTPHAESIRALRDEIFNSLDLFEGGRTGRFDTGITTTVTAKHSGRIYRTGTKQNPKDVMGDNPFILGVGVKGEEAGLGHIRVPNAPEGYNKDWVIPEEHIGKTFMLVPTANGRITYTKVLTEKIKFLPELHQEIVEKFTDEMNQDNWQEVRDDIWKDMYVDFIYEDGQIIHRKVDKKGNRSRKVIEYEELRSWVGEMMSQVDADKINEGDYNDQLGDAGKIITNLHPNQFTHSSRIEVTPYDAEQKSEEKVLSDEVSAAITDALTEEEQVIKDLDPAVGVNETTLGDPERVTIKKSKNNVDGLLNDGEITKEDCT